MGDQELKKMSTKAKRVLWGTFIIGGLFCLAMPWWTFIILGVVLFIEYAVAVAPDDEPAAEEEATNSGEQPTSQPPQEDNPQEAKKQPSDEEQPSDEKRSPDEIRYCIVMEKLEGFDIDGLNALYKKLNEFDAVAYPKIEDVAGKNKFPDLPLVLFENLTESQRDLLMDYLPTYFGGNGGTIQFAAHPSPTVFPDTFEISVGTLFNSETLEFVKVTGLKHTGVCEDYWVSTKPLYWKYYYLLKKQMGERVDRDDLMGKLENSGLVELNWLEGFFEMANSLRPDSGLPTGFRFGCPSIPQMKYAVRGGQHGNPYKHPGTDNAAEFEKGNSVNALGMTPLNLTLRSLKSNDDFSQIEEVNLKYSPSDCSWYSNKSPRDSWDAGYWPTIRVDVKLMAAAKKYRMEQQRLQKTREEEQQKEQRAREAEQRAREAEQKAADAAVLRRQKLLQKRKEEENK